MNKLWIVAAETYKRNVKSVAFLVMILMPFIMLAIGGVFGYLMTQSSNNKTVAIIAEDSAYRTAFMNQKSESYTINKKITTENQAKKALKQEKIDSYFVIKGQDAKVEGLLYSSSNDYASLQADLTQKLTAMKTSIVAEQLNLSQEQLRALNEPAKVTSTTLKFEGDKENKSSNQGLMMMGALAASFLIFLFIVNYSSIIGQEIASEKGTRIMEIILSSIKATTHFYGKLIGILLVCLTQIIIYGVLGIVAYQNVKKIELVQQLLSNVKLHDLVTAIFGYNLLFFVLGVLAFAVLSAFLGSLVSRTEDVAKSIQPIVFIAIAGFYIGIFVGQNNPESIIVKITSFIPLLSSFVMPFRIASGTVATPEIWISLLLLAVASVALTIISANFYRSNVLIYSDGGTWKALKKSMVLMKNEKRS